MNKLGSLVVLAVATFTFNNAYAQKPGWEEQLLRNQQNAISSTDAKANYRGPVAYAANTSASSSIALDAKANKDGEEFKVWGNLLTPNADYSFQGKIGKNTPTVVKAAGCQEYYVQAKAEWFHEDFAFGSYSYGYNVILDVYTSNGQKVNGSTVILKDVDYHFHQGKN